jgi:predicted SAM-dependent methyltransferase
VPESKVGYPSFPTLVIGLPYSGRPLPPRLQAAFHSCSPPMNYNTVMLDTMGMPIDAARNYFAEKAIELNAKYLFFWDEDVVLVPHALRELIFMMEHHPECAVIGGIYCLKSERPEPLVFNGIGNGPYWDWKVGEVFTCTAIGMGCTLIRVDSFKDLEKPYFKSVDDMSPYLDNIRFGEQWTEDLYYCKKIVDTKKWIILAHGQLLLQHVDVRTGRTYELPPESKPMRALEMPGSKLKVVDLGCGTDKLRMPGGKVIGVDIRDLEGVDYRCDLHRLPFASGEFDIAFSSHVLEHFPRNEAIEVLKEWTRIIKPTGEIRLKLPNLQWALDHLHEPERSKHAMNVIYGEQAYPEDFHKNGFTPESLSKLLDEVGFKKQEVRTEQEGYNILMRAWRAQDKPPKKLKGKK